MAKNDIGELLTKAEFDKYYKELLQQTEDKLEALHKQYIALLDFRRDYREDYKSYRISHYLTKGSSLQYKKVCKRQVGFLPTQKLEDE